MNVALTIAGSDSGGGAGIQADLKTFHRFGVFGTSVITAITAQNTLGVTEWEAVRPELVKSQIDAVASDLRPAAFKTGMLATSSIVRVVADGIRKYGLSNYVLDPVMVATSGDLLIEDDAVASIRDELLPLADLITPNADEASVLAGFTVNTEDDMQRAAEAIAALGSKAVLIKGGHIRGGDSATVVDCLYDGSFITYRHPRIETTNTHGIGCTLSAAITASLANGSSLRDAVQAATDFVHEAIATAPGLGHGSGPLNNFAGSAPTNSRTSA
ncbi:MAG TPA: bifunctional hydroxymethylpyrimidine kinase/phosphomethylpyrimidine kinase, partial [Gemmatimonadaceae bacterium]|nr:bifunctional hydroxymethylpyrimidine kinase/phosphomethylpyrimidine kinase [Gemmatimonadaceae bacterium]